MEDVPPSTQYLLEHWETMDSEIWAKAVVDRAILDAQAKVAQRKAERTIVVIMPPLPYQTARMMGDKLRLPMNPKHWITSPERLYGVRDREVVLLYGEGLRGGERGWRMNRMLERLERDNCKITEYGADKVFGVVRPW